MDGIRAKESSTNDVYINVNDLLIELMVELEKAHTEQERAAIKRIINRLTRVRDTAHGSSSKF